MDASNSSQSSQSTRLLNPGHPALLCALLLLITIGVFWPALHNGFVNFDDDLYVTANPQVRQGLTWEGLRWAFRQDANTGNWHPLTWLSHMADCALFGMSPWGHHLTNILLHAANAVLVFLVVRGMTAAVWRSFVVALLFALHPLRVESVAWVAERKDVLSGFFWLLTIWAYFQYSRSLKSQTSNPKLSGIGTRALTCYAVALAFFALGLMSKPMLVTLPFVLLLLDYWPLARAAGPGSSNGWLLLEKLPFFLLAAGSSVVTFFAQKGGGAVKGISALPLNSRIQNALVSYCRYLGKTFYPAHLAVFYPRPSHWPMEAALGACALLAAVTVLVLASRRRHPYAVTGWFWYLITLAPVIGLIQVGEQAMADRYTYIPMLGILIALVWGSYDLSLKFQISSAWLVSAGTLASIFFAAATYFQIGYWENSETLFEHTAKVTADNYVAYYHLGDFYTHHGRPSEAAQMYERAIAISPRSVQAHDSLGNLLLGQGQIDRAINEFEEALKCRPDYALAHGNLGVALYEKGQSDLAVAELHEALRLDPGYADAHFNLGTVLQDEGHFDQAVGEFKTAVKLRPFDIGARNSLGAALIRQGRFDEAVQELKEALQRQPDSAEAHFHLGVALAAQRHHDEAVAELRRTLELEPGYADAKQQLEKLQAGSTAH